MFIWETTYLPRPQANHLRSDWSQHTQLLFYSGTKEPWHHPEAIQGQNITQQSVPNPYIGKQDIWPAILTEGHSDQTAERMRYVRIIHPKYGRWWHLARGRWKQTGESYFLGNSQQWQKWSWSKISLGGKSSAQNSINCNWKQCKPLTANRWKESRISDT